MDIPFHGPGGPPLPPLSICRQRNPQRVPEHVGTVIPFLLKTNMSNFQIEDQLALNGGGCGMSMYLDPPKRSLESKPSPTGSQKEDEPQNGESASSSTMSRTSSRSTISIKTAKSAINDDPGMSDLYDSFSDVFTTITVSSALEIATVTKSRKEKGFVVNIKQKISTQNSHFEVPFVCFLDRIYYYYGITLCRS